MSVVKLQISAKMAKMPFCPFVVDKFYILLLIPFSIPPRSGGIEKGSNKSYLIY